MALLGLVLRALGVVLLAATVLLPVADHHAASRLPESFARPESVHDLIAHHHAHAGAPSFGDGRVSLEQPLPGAPTAPVVVPGSSFWADGLVVPTAAREDGVSVAAPVIVGWLGATDVAPPPSLDRAPPAPPPIAAA